MFAFKYSNGDYISVYFDMKNYYFDYDELKNIMDDDNGCVLKSARCLRLVNKLKRRKFMSFDETLVLLDCYYGTHDLKQYIIKRLYPVLITYKKSYNKY
jgi:hypothetical protein